PHRRLPSRCSRSSCSTNPSASSLRKRRVRRSRAPMRLTAVALALLRWPFQRGRRRSSDPRRILVLHHLLLGDTMMLTGLLAKLRARHPRAEIVMTVARPFAGLYAGRPYGVRAHAFDP